VARQPEWLMLPPIQRSVETLRPVSPQNFGDSLSSWRNPSFLAPLGHLVSADAPAGVIHRLIEPTAPPSDHQAGSALEYATAAPQRPPQGSVVQRMLAVFSPRASDGNDPPPLMSGGGVPSERPFVAPPPTPSPAPDPPAPPASRPIPVQRSVPGPAPMTQVPPVTLPVLELPVLTAPPATRETAFEAEPDSVESQVTDESPASGDSAGGVAPTLGMSPPPSATEPVDGGAGGRAEVTGQEHGATAPVIEWSSQGAPAHPTVQRSAVADPVVPAPPELSDVVEAPTLGMSPPPSATQPVDGGAGGPVEVTGQEHGATAPVIESSSQGAPAHPTVQRSAVADPVTAASRRLGLGPPLAPDALTAQRIQATPRSPAIPMAKPPLVVTPPPPEPAGQSDVEGPGSVESPLSSGELIAPLIGQSGSVPVQGGAPTTDAVATDAVSMPTVQTVQEASPPQAEPPLPVLPVLRAHDSPVSPPADPSAPPADLSPGALTEPTRPVPVVSARPVVARLVGDRTPPLLAAPSPTAELADPGGPAQQRLSGAALSVQRTHAEPLLTGGAPARDHAVDSIAQFTLSEATNVAAGAAGGVVLRPAGYPNGGPAPVAVQRMPSVGPPAPVVQAASWQAPVVQTAPLEPAVDQIVAPAPPESPASDIPADSGADVPGEPDNPGQVPSTVPPAGPGTPAGPGAPAAAASLDELVKKLFDPLLRRLKTELRLDRERRGVLTDLRH